MDVQVTPGYFQVTQQWMSRLFLDVQVIPMDVQVILQVIQVISFQVQVTRFTRLHLQVNSPGYSRPPGYPGGYPGCPQIERSDSACLNDPVSSSLRISQLTGHIPIMQRRSRSYAWEHVVGLQRPPDRNQLRNAGTVDIMAPR
jgi:hypothetical protein